MAYGYGKVAVANFVGFFVGLYLYLENTSTDLQTIHLFGFIALMIGMLTMIKVRGLGGVFGGFINGFGLGVAFGTYFLNNN